MDPSNGGVYTLTEFTAEYYGTAEWDTAGEALAARCEVERLYGEHEPAKLADVAALVAKYGAADLLCKVRAKYAAAEVAKEAKEPARRPSLAVSVVSDGPGAGGDAPAEGVFGLLPDDVLLMILTLLRIVNSPFGRVLQAVRENRFRAEALGWAGRADEGHDVLAVLVEEQPEDATLLNSLCWHGARWTEVDDSLIAICTRAVETAENPAAARDSRALALFRAGRNPEALADLDAVLATAPDQQESRYLRGIVRLAEGDSRGREDIAAVNHASPLIARTYAAYGIEP